MAETQVSIANMALTLLGVKAISSVTESSEPARKVLLTWNNAVDTVLRDHDWNFARRVGVPLVASPTFSVTGWEYAYAKPTKCASIRAVYNEGTLKSKSQQEYVEALSTDDNAVMVLSNLEDALCDYTYLVTDVSLFPPDFAEALALYLASRIGAALTGSDSKATQMFQRYQMAIGPAKANNKAEGSDSSEAASPYEDAR